MEHFMKKMLWDDLDNTKQYQLKAIKFSAWMRTFRQPGQRF